MVSGLVLVTGGLESFWFYLYFLVILASGILFYRRGGILMAGYLSVFYGLLLLLQYQGLLAGYLPWYENGAAYPWETYGYQWGMATAAFFLAGYLGSFFPEQSFRQRRPIDRPAKEYRSIGGFNQQIIHHLDMGLITLDSRGHILSINPAGEEILGQDTSRIEVSTDAGNPSRSAADSRMARPGPGRTI